jgi:hypothetical protein
MKNGSEPADEVIGFVANAIGLSLDRRSGQFVYV